VTIPVIYQRFGGKPGLFVAVAEDAYAQGITQLRQAVENTRTFDDAVDATLAEFATLYEVDPSVGAIVVTVLLEAGRDDELGQALRPAMREFRRFVDDIADLAPDDLAANVTERRILARSLVTLFSGIMISAPNFSKATDYEDAVNGIRKMIRRPRG
jgi:AcrR family transcriptional regulator